MRLRMSEYPAPVRGSLQVGAWPHNNFQRFIRRVELTARVGIRSVQSLLVMADPILLPCPADHGLLLGGLEISTEGDRKYEYSQLWLVRPCADGQALPGVHWDSLAPHLPSP